MNFLYFPVVKKMKKCKILISILLALLIILPYTASGLAADDGYRAKQALSVTEGIEALRGQFESGYGPEAGGVSLDYKFYSPVGENDTTKYPIVMFLHGIGHGDYEGSQLDDSDMPYWSSAEFQARFSDAGGAFILLPRAPEEKKQYWGESFVEPLKALLDDFIATHAENVDTTRIAVTGSSAGGGMCWTMLEAFPGFFSCAFPMASTVTPDTDVIKAAKSTAIWVLASQKDPVVNYRLSTLKVWNKILKYNNHPENCRLSTFQNVYLPDGVTRASDNHHLASVITYDLHTHDEGLYPELETIDGSGNVVDLTSPNGLITWISSIHSDYDGTATKGTGNIDITKFSSFMNAWQNWIYYIVHIFQRMLGL